jgi:Abortive infection alpha
MEDKKLDITSTAVEKGLDLVKGFVEKIAGSALEETGLLISDKIKMVRFKNQLKMLQKAQEIVKENGFNIKQISLKTLVPLLEYSSLEDDETLQEKWANLLANFANANEKYESTIYPFILSQLSKEDVHTIDLMYKGRYEPSTGGVKYSHSPKGIVRSNLARLGLIEIVLPKQYNDPKPSLFKSHLNHVFPRQNEYDISELGKDFVECCSTGRKLPLSEEELGYKDGNPLFGSNNIL